MLLGITGFLLGDLNAQTLTLTRAIIVFMASAGASAAYLPASEVFPAQTRALCIAFFYAIGTAVGGISGPLLLGYLIEHIERASAPLSPSPRRTTSARTAAAASTSAYDP